MLCVVLLFNFGHEHFRLVLNCCPSSSPQVRIAPQETVVTVILVVNTKECDVTSRTIVYIWLYLFSFSFKLLP